MCDFLLKLLLSLHVMTRIWKWTDTIQKYIDDAINFWVSFLIFLHFSFLMASDEELSKGMNNL